MKKCAVFLVCDENLVFAMANMVLQLSKYDFIDSIIIYLDSKNDIIKNVFLFLVSCFCYSVLAELD